MLKQYLCQTTQWFVLFQSAGPTEGPRPLALQRARTLKEITLHFFRCGKISITNSLLHFLPPSLCHSQLQRSWIFFSTQSSFINKIFFYSPWKNPIYLLDTTFTCSFMSARSSACSRSACTFLNLARLRAAISSASSICFLQLFTYVG